MKIEKIDYIVCLLSDYLADGDIASTGVASLLPMLAILLAQRTHAPSLQYLNCIGAVNPEFETVGFASEDARALQNKKAFLPLHELFDLGAKGRIDTMFFSGAQIDSQGNANLSSIGKQQNPEVKLAGPAGSSVMMKKVKKPILFTLKHSKRVLVSEVDFASSYGLRYHDSIDLVTDLGVFELTKDKVSLVGIHPWADEKKIRENTGFDFRTDANLRDLSPNKEYPDTLNKLDKERVRYQLGV